ncbi:hypothetical protein Tco_0661779 [Tanacetum coccineum]
MSNVSPQQYSSQSSTTPLSKHVPPVTYQPHFVDNTQLDSELSPTDNLIKNLTNTLALLTQIYKTYLPQTNNQLRTSSNTRNQATVQDGRVVVQNVQGRQNRGQGNHPRGAGAAGNGGVQNRVGNANPAQARQIKCYNCNAQENGVVLDEEQLLFLTGGHDTVVDEDVDESLASTAHTMFMANLSSADPVYEEASPSYDSDILSEVHEYDNYQDAACEHHDVHEMHHDVQPNCVVDSNADYTSDSNMITYDQYVKDNAEPVVQSNVSSVPNDAYMMIINEMHEQTAQSVYAKEQNKVVNASLTAELATYKEQVELYERRAKFELIEREQKIEEQLRIVITDRNIKEENLKKELHSVKMQLNSTINHNKSMVEEVTSLKKDFKQKENKYLEEFLDMKALKEKDVLKMKAKALKEQTKASRPIKALTVKYDEIERKNLLIANDNLIADCLSKEVFYIATNSELSVSRFTEMHDAHTVVLARCLELEAELSKLHDQLKYQHLKESFENNKSLPARDAPDFDSVFVIEKMKASIQGKDNAIKKLRM